MLDYRGAPYLRFFPAGVAVNENSPMFYLNQVPAEIPPTNLGPATPPHWDQVASGDAYGWHDGRLHALATTVQTPGSRHAGTWRVPLRVDGAATAISGGLYYAPDPSIVWFWPILVALACVPAVLRLGRTRLDERVARGLALVALAGFAWWGPASSCTADPTSRWGRSSSWSRCSPSRPGGCSRWRGDATAGSRSSSSRRGLWEGASTIAVLLDGFVLLALPTVPARVAVVACLAAGVGLLLGGVHHGRAS